MTTRRRLPPVPDVLARVLLACLSAIVATQAFCSIGWPMEEDPPLLHYAAYLVDAHGYVPYRDVFETSMPGTFWFHLALGKLFGYGDLAFRLVDLGWLAVLLAVAWRLMRPFSAVAAWAACALFALQYFFKGHAMSLQRDYIAVLPVAVAALVAGSGRRPALRALAIGCLFGLAALIKPHMLIGLPVVLAALYVANRGALPWRDIRPAAVCALGVAIPVAVALAWLAALGGLGAFLEMLTHYLPLHSAMTGDHVTISGSARAAYLWRGFVAMGGYRPWLIAALTGGAVVWFGPGADASRRLRAATLLGLAAAYAVYPVLADKFWDYHYMPLAFFVILSASLCLARPVRSLPMLVLIVSAWVSVDIADFTRGIAWQIRKGCRCAPVQYGRVDDISGWLLERMEPGDTAQPVDWTSGAVHAMLRARIPLATSFLYDYHFHHHVSNPYIVELRRRFMTQLEERRPRFIIEVRKKAKVSGADTSPDFPELERFIADHYTPGLAEREYTVYERAW